MIPNIQISNHMILHLLSPCFRTLVLHCPYHFHSLIYPSYTNLSWHFIMHSQFFNVHLLSIFAPFKILYFLFTFFSFSCLTTPPPSLSFSFPLPLFFFYSLFPWFGEMGRRHLHAWLILLLLMAHSVGTSNGSRHTQVFNMQPKSQGLSQNFFGFLPKAMPLPPSGPSRQHNSIQLQNSRGKKP